ncbi:uncharacterized protein LOC135397307 [Ornithodoros turicata]
MEMRPRKGKAAERLRKKPEQNTPTTASSENHEGDSTVRMTSTPKSPVKRTSRERVVKACRNTAIRTPSVLTDATNLRASTPVDGNDPPIQSSRDLSPLCHFDLEFDYPSAAGVWNDVDQENTVESERPPSPETSIHYCSFTYAGRRRPRAHKIDFEAENPNSEGMEGPPLYHSPLRDILPHETESPKKRRRIVSQKKKCHQWPAYDEWAQKMAKEFEQISKYELVFE